MSPSKMIFCMDFVELNLRIPKNCVLVILGVAAWIYGHFKVGIGVPHGYKFSVTRRPPMEIILVPKVR